MSATDKRSHNISMQLFGAILGDISTQIAMLIALLFVSPLMIFIAIAIKIDSPGPVIFAQKRVGRHGVAFNCYKFRTMQVDAPLILVQLLEENEARRLEWERSRKLRSDPRITRVGVFLRKSSLDELPQLINVLTGAMNLVGPRPIVPEEARLYGRSLRHYCSVRPGITGPWQVSGRSNTTFARRVAHDRLYAQRRSVWSDCSILIRTVPAVCFSRGAH
jgi:lipopolysaccharide/colanic/teichoic acid biosynthesis glycosyltransferase